MNLASIPFDGVAGLARDLIDRFIPDPQKKLEAQARANELQLQLVREGTHAERAELELAKGQVAVNVAEASHGSRWTSGWRPFIGWVCGAGFAVQFVVGPLGEWLARLAGHDVAFPPLDTNTMLPLLFGMLGLGTMRTFEKTRGVAT